MTTDIMTAPIGGMVGVTHGSANGIEPIMVAITGLTGMIAIGMAFPIALIVTEITTESLTGAIGALIILIVDCLIRLGASRVGSRETLFVSIGEFGRKATTN